MLINKNCLVAILIFLILGIAYCNSIFNKFSYDDISAVEENEFIASLSNIPDLITHKYFTGSGEKSYRPLVTLTYMIDYELWNRNPFGYHLSNFILHALAVLSIFFVGKTLLNNNAYALLGALVFACNPVNTESICAVSFREDIMCGLFLFLAFLGYLKFRLSGKFWWLAVSLSAYVMSLLSKEMGIAFIAVVFLFELFYFKKPDSWFSFLLSHIIYFLITVLFLMARFVWLKNADDYYPQIKFNIVVMIKTIILYFQLYFFPINLRALYYDTHIFNNGGEVFRACLIIILSIIFLLLLDKNTRKLCFFMLISVFVSFLPVLNIYPVRHVVAERYMYLPSMCFIFFMAVFFYNTSIDKYRKMVLVLIAVIITNFSIMALLRNSVWKDNLTLWHNTSKNNPWLAEAFYSLGHAYGLRNNMDRSILAYKRAIKLKPEYFDPYVNLGRIYVDKGLLKEGLKNYLTAMAIDPNDVILNYNLGLLYHQLNDYDKALTCFKKCLDADSGFYKAYSALGVIYARKGDMDKAASYWQKAIEKNPSFAQAYSNLGSLYANKNDLDKARYYWNKALEIDPDYKKARDDLNSIDKPFK